MGQLANQSTLGLIGGGEADRSFKQWQYEEGEVFSATLKHFTFSSNDPNHNDQPEWLHDVTPLRVFIYKGSGGVTDVLELI